MRVFECKKEECAGFCELTIFADDLEERFIKEKNNDLIMRASPPGKMAPVPASGIPTLHRA
ncbi:MAG: hypothetical protein SWO11_23775 [Thermodesulfobacteriota bacterium]|nr:hypothetical protein [Thermodesulfobacteriota bacterium]